MKKKITVTTSLLLVAVMLCGVLAACSGSADTSSEFAEDYGSTREHIEAPAEGADVYPTQSDYDDSDNTAATQNYTQPAEKRTERKYVIMSFSAVQGAVITDLDYDDDGYLHSCSYKKKCEACGNPESGNATAYGNLNSSFHCMKCKNTQKVEIIAIKEWVDVEVDY